MKNLNILTFVLVGLLTVSSCIDDDNDALTGNENEGGLITPSNAALGYVVGDDATYTAGGSIYQGNVATTSVSVYKSFNTTVTDPETGIVTPVSSNEVLLTTIPISQTSLGTTATFSFSFTYEDLIAGLTLSGAPISPEDSNLTIGDFWTLRYASNTTSGQNHLNRGTTKVSVGTRFAGSYRTIDAKYWRLGVLTYTTPNWPAVTLIESVDATTYRVVEYFGAVLFTGNTWYFKIDENDNITYPATTPSGDPQLGNGQPFISCATNASDMVPAPCGATTDRVERDDINGADKLYMSFGYFTAGSGPRVLYHVLEKIVE